MKNLKFSIIICDNESGIKGTLDTISKQSYKNTEVIILTGDATNAINLKNNSGEDQLNHIQYLNCNAESALGYVTGDWVTFMRAGDGLIPGALEKLAGLIIKYEVQAIQSRCLNYSPSGGEAGLGEILIPSKKGVVKRDAKEWLGKVIGGRVAYQELPALHTGGFVSSRTLAEIRNKGLPFYRSSVLDVYSAIAITSILDDYLFIYEPIAIRKTFNDGAETANVINSDATFPQDKFPGNQKIPFHNDIVVDPGQSTLPSVQLMVYESYLKSQYLRLENSQSSHAAQLAVILSRTSKHNTEVYQWGKKFARHYGLSFEDIQRESNSRSTLTLLQSILTYRFNEWIPRYKGSETLRMSSVDEAAAAIPSLKKKKSKSFIEYLRHLENESRIYFKYVCFCSGTVIFRALKRAANKIGYDLVGVKKGPADPTLELTQELRKLLDLFQIDFVIDIGANVGQFGSSLRQSGYSGKILSFEPLSSAHQALVKQTEGDARWEVYPRCALGDQDGEIEINIAGNSQSSSVLPMMDMHTDAAPDSAYIGAEKTAIWRVDSVVSSYLMSLPRTFFKLDTQGYEWQVFDGAPETLKKVHGILCELSLTPLYEQQRLWVDIVQRMEAAGFFLWAVYPGFTDPASRRMLQVDAVFFRK